MDKDFIPWPYFRASVALVYYLVGALALLLVLFFLSFTAYLHYVHWKYSHIPQPKRPRYVMSVVRAPATEALGSIPGGCLGFTVLLL